MNELHEKEFIAVIKQIIKSKEDFLLLQEAWDPAWGTLTEEKISYE